MKFVRLMAIPGSVLIVGATLVAANAASAAPGARSLQAADASQYMAINCEYSALCAEVANPSEIFGSHYVGHDEPSDLFYSNVPGSGNNMTYSMTLPHDPSAANPTTPGKSYQFQLNGALWFGMALCGMTAGAGDLGWSRRLPPHDDHGAEAVAHPGSVPRHAELGRFLNHDGSVANQSAAS